MKILVAVILIFVIADMLIVAYVFLKRYKKRLPQRVINEIQEGWKQIIREKDHRHAIMEADKLLDYSLGRMGYKGSLGAKLKKAPRLFRDINGVWEAHKVRNNIAHKINYRVTQDAYKKTMLQFKQAFKDLNIF